MTLEPGRPQGRIAADRTDQAYGHDLVHQGFVVLAPDSINCGERNIEAIRESGQNRGCFELIDEQLGRPWRRKHVFDNMRAVDLLQSLDFVDSQRIGAIGHSMGAGDVFDLMAVDQRIKAGVVSGDGMSDPSASFLPLMSPRLYIGIRGEFDGTPGALRKAHQMHANARPFFEADGAEENLVLLTAKMGHWFGDKLKWKAYKRLKEHFGVLPSRTVVDLGEIVAEAKGSQPMDGRGGARGDVSGGEGPGELSCPGESEGSRKRLGRAVPTCLGSGSKGRTACGNRRGQG